MDLLPEPNSTFWKTGRLKTYDHWPFQSPEDNTCNPERMAVAGFLAVGGKEEPDLVECFICSKQLDGWDPDDDPWKEHKNHQPQCPFVILNKLDQTSWTVEELLDLLKKYVIKECTHNLETAIVKAKEERANLVSEIPRIFKGIRKSLKDLN